jgi:hypothetical protein
VELSLTPQECGPGDMVELHARMRRPDFAEFELRMPENESIHFVARENGKVIYQAGLYSQDATWTLQPVEAGTIELSGIIASIKHGGMIEEVALPAPKLVVRGDAAPMDSPDPLPLPKPDKATAISAWIIPALAAVVVVILLVRRFRKKPEIVLGDLEMPATDIAALRSALIRGEWPIGMIEGILAGSDDLAPHVRMEMARSIYSPVSRRAELQALLEREAAK